MKETELIAQLRREIVRLTQQNEVLQNCASVRDIEIRRLQKRLIELEQHLNPPAA